MAANLYQTRSLECLRSQHTESVWESKNNDGRGTENPGNPSIVRVAYSLHRTFIKCFAYVEQLFIKAAVTDIYILLGPHLQKLDTNKSTRRLWSDLPYLVVVWMQSAWGNSVSLIDSAQLNKKVSFGPKARPTQLPGGASIDENWQPQHQIYPDTLWPLKEPPIVGCYSCPLDAGPYIRHLVSVLRLAAVQTCYRTDSAALFARRHLWWGN